MDNAIILKGQNGSIEIEYEHTRWMEIFFTNGNRIAIGEDGSDILRDRFLDFFQNYEKKEVMGTVEGQNVVWVLSTSNGHSIYGTKADEEIIFYFQDPDANFIGNIHLSADDQKLWIEKIKTMAD